MDASMSFLKVVQGWGGWLADFKDCSGNTLTLVQNG